jgi:hypothetical protein
MSLFNPFHISQKKRQSNFFLDQTFKTKLNLHNFLSKNSTMRLHQGPTSQKINQHDHTVMFQLRCREILLVLKPSPYWNPNLFPNFQSAFFLRGWIPQKNIILQPPHPPDHVPPGRNVGNPNLTIIHPNPSVINSSRLVSPSANSDTEKIRLLPATQPHHFSRNAKPGKGPYADSFCNPTDKLRCYLLGISPFQLTLENEETGRKISESLGLSWWAFAMVSPHNTFDSILTAFLLPGIKRSRWRMISSPLHTFTTTSHIHKHLEKPHASQ